jgi:hypothetical protein
MTERRERVSFGVDKHYSLLELRPSMYHLPYRFVSLASEISVGAIFRVLAFHASISRTISFRLGAIMKDAERVVFVTTFIEAIRAAVVAWIVVVRAAPLSFRGLRLGTLGLVAVSTASLSFSLAAIAFVIHVTHVFFPLVQSIVKEAELSATTTEVLANLHGPDGISKKEKPKNLTKHHVSTNSKSIFVMKEKVR